jgi:drug/metabolite transporter (DMT)-like permease
MRRTTLYLLMGLHVLFAAVTYVLGRHAAQGWPSPAALALARAVGSSVLLAALMGTLVPAPSFSRADWWKVLGLGVLLVPLNQYFFLLGLRDTVPGHPAVIYAMTPVGVLLLQSGLDRRLPRALTVLGVTAALAGVVVVLRPWVRGPEFAEIRRGDTWILVGLLVWVVYTVAARPLVRAHDARTVTAWSMVLGTLVFVPFAGVPLVSTDFSAVPLRAWVGLAWLAAVTSTVMMLLWNRMLRQLEPVEVAVCANAQSVATALLVWVLAVTGLEAPAEEQDLGPLYWLGTALVVVGVMLVQRRAQPRLLPAGPAPK